jgi:hypothetical protein
LKFSLSPPSLLMLLLLQLSSQLCLRSQKLCVLGFGVWLFFSLAFVFVFCFFCCNKFCLARRRRRRCRRFFVNLRDHYPPPFFPLQVREKICSDLFFFVVVSTLLMLCYSRREREREIEREITLSVSGRRASFLRKKKKKSKSKGISIDVREKNLK